MKNHTPRLKWYISLVLSGLTALALPGALPAQSAAKVDFAKDIQPILRANCVGCHGAAMQQANLRLDRRSSVIGSFTPRIVPGSSDTSRLFLRLSGASFGPQMPPSGPIRPEQIALIKKWIDQGAEWPDALANEADLPPLDPKAVAMVDMLHNGDLPAFLKAASETPALLNARAAGGSTPFMYAALYCDAATLAKLLKMGADPKKQDDSHATALLWAASDLDKTRLLIEHRADVNARSDDLRTPLMNAARHPGGAPIVKLLLDHGAKPNPNASPRAESSPLTEAATAGDAETMELLLKHGADAKAAGQPALSMSALLHCSQCLHLLAAKIDEKEDYTATLLENAVYGNLDDVRLLIEKGADVNAYDPMGRTPLMYAAVSNVFPLEIVKLLTEHGADINAKSRHPLSADSGLTVLDLARFNGKTAIVDFLVKAGAKSSNPSAPQLHPRAENSVRAAVQDTLPLIQRSDKKFSAGSGCISCHNNSVSAMAIGLARSRGFHVDEATAAAQVQANVRQLQRAREHLNQGYMFTIGDTFSPFVLGYMLAGLHAEHHAPDLNTDAVAIYLLSRQRSDGQWPSPPGDSRQPICSVYIGQTALAMRALQLYAPKLNHAAYDKAVRLSAAWLAKVRPINEDDAAWRLAGLAWAGLDKAAINKARQELIALQRADGGFADLASVPSNAYSTGIALYALHLAGLPATDAAYQRGVRYLLSTQQQDGSWYVKSRALGFQPYFEADFPHKFDQWSSAAGSSWAALALAAAAPDAPHTVAENHTRRR